MKPVYQSRLFCPAKLNLGLLIPFRYPDGYHHIVSLFVPIDFGDTLSLEFFQGSEGKSPLGSSPVELLWKNNLPKGFGDTKGIERSFNEHPEENLLSRAGAIASEIVQKRLPQLPHFQMRATLEKKIPSPAGLGGGSSDAGALFRGVLEYIEFKGVETSLLTEIRGEFEKKALLLGSDIPFFLELSGALISGRGEIFKRVGDFPLSGLLGVPNFGFDTPAMYRALDRPRITPEELDELPNLENIMLHHTKSTLHTDRDMILSLRAAHSSFESLLTWFRPEGAQTGQLPQAIPGLLECSDPGLCRFQNDFTEAAKNMFPKEALFLENSQRKAGETLKKEIAKQKRHRPLLTSMSGSGTAIFAAFPGRDFPEVVGEAEALMRSQIPEMFWTGFQTIPVK